MVPSKVPDYIEGSEALLAKIEQASEKHREKALAKCQESLVKASEKVIELIESGDLSEAQGRGAAIQLKASLALLKGLGVLTEKVTHDGEVGFVPLTLKRVEKIEE